MKKLSEIVFENKVTQEVVHAGMVGIHELMTDDKFLDWFEKLSDKILSKLTMYEIYQKFQREVKK
jgi:hypothetical protein